MLSAKEIMEIIPHRYPFLLVDRILELEPGKRAVGIKNVTANEPQFTGHFPGNPVFPGVLTLEALAQVCAVAMLSLPENKGKLGVYAGVDEVRFKRMVVPGDTLRMEIEIVTMRRGICKCNASAYVGDQLACSGVLTFGMVEQ